MIKYTQYKRNKRLLMLDHFEHYTFDDLLKKLRHCISFFLSDQVTGRTSRQTIDTPTHN